jgi:VanZ family protein
MNVKASAAIRTCIRFIFFPHLCAFNQLFKMQIYLVRYKFSILTAFLIALVSLVPGNSIPGVSLFYIPGLDKLVHIGMYALLGFVVLLEGRNQFTGSRSKLLLILILFLLGAIIEVAQATLVSTRSAEWLDLAANLCGLVAGCISYRFLRWFRS